MRENRILGWVSDNPVTFVVILLTLIGGVALVVGYREGFMAILGGLLPWIKSGDAENKQRLEESRRNTDLQFAKVYELANGMKEQQAQHDQEVMADAESAKAECEGLDVDELIDIGNAMLREHGILRGDQG